MHNEKYICPICGYTQLSEPPYDEYGCSSYDICPCCGNQFGYSDSGFSHKDLRKVWVSEDCRWNSAVISPPENWDPIAQLKKQNLLDVLGLRIR